MSWLDDAANAAADVASDPAGAAASAGEQIVDAVTGAASQASQTAAEAQDAASDETHSAAVWILDSAIALASEAARSTSDALNDAENKAKEAECQRTWATVAAVVAMVVLIIIAVVVTVFTFGAAGPMLAAAVMTAAAMIGAVVVVAVAAAAVAQAALIAAIRAIGIIVGGSQSKDERSRVARDAIEGLKRAMGGIQSAAAQRLPAKTLNPEKSLAASEQTLRALQKLLALFRSRPISPKMSMLVARLAQLEQTHAALVGHTRTLKIKLETPKITNPVAPVTPPGPVKPITLTTNAISVGVKR